jgi:hypothetical protein
MAQRLQRLAGAVRSPGFDRFLVPAFLAAFVIARAGRFEERDPYWQARAGLENLAGWPLARPDTWSWSGVEGLWYQNSPLWDSVLGLGWVAAGFFGIFVVFAVVMGSYFALANLLGRSLGGRALPTLAAVLVTVSPALSMLNPRATLVVQVIVLAAVYLAYWLARGPASRGPAVLTAALVGVLALAFSTLGNWVHLSFLLIGPGMALLWGIIWGFAPLARQRKWLLIIFGGLGWALGPVLSPYGLAGGLARSQAVQDACEGLILEWTTPLSATVSPVFWLMAAAAVVAAGLASVWLWRRWRQGERSLEFGVLVALSALGVPAALAGLTAIRFLGIGLLTLAPVMAVAATAAVDGLRERQRAGAGLRWREQTTGAYWRVVSTAVVVFLLPGSLYLGAKGAVPDEAGVVALLPANCQLFASGAISSVVVLTRPDVPVWIDGRADFFGRDHLLATYAFLAVRAPTLVPEGTRCVLLDLSSIESSLLAPALDSSAQWRVLVSQDHYRIWVPAGS